jgi:hypothetical protein
MSNGKKDEITCAFHGDMEMRIGRNSNTIKKNNDLIHELDKRQVRAFVFGSLQLIGLVVILIKLFFM